MSEQQKKKELRKVEVTLNYLTLIKLGIGIGIISFSIPFFIFTGYSFGLGFALILSHLFS